MAAAELAAINSSLGEAVAQTHQTAQQVRGQRSLPTRLHRLAAVSIRGLRRRRAELPQQHHRLQPALPLGR